jgi:para-aminobenzoate synthetase component 1
METVCFYWQHHHLGPLLGVGMTSDFKLSNPILNNDLNSYLNENEGRYLFGYLNFDLKNAFEKLNSKHPDPLGFPLLHFWAPESLFLLKEEPQFLAGKESNENLEFAKTFMVKMREKAAVLDIEFKPRTSQNRYYAQFEQLQKALQRGDIYEVNYCQEFYVENCAIQNPIGLFGRLNQLTKAPHAAYFQTDSHQVLCASPERFLQKKGTHLRSEPIKGTAPRSADQEQDQQLAQALKSDPKERAENIMIVDLVRNDLSRVAAKDSVQVDELCEIYSFETVHQMISKISCQLSDSADLESILTACFPMGSMTGAPKIEALRQIDTHEDFRRGLYSGSIGLIEPNGDFDFNVVIRSLLYNKASAYLSCAVGSAITIQASADAEYQECLLKAEKLIHGLK